MNNGLKNIEEDPGELVIERSTDAYRWAQAFIATKKRNDWTLKDIDEGLMLSWFAAVIETTKDAG